VKYLHLVKFSAARVRHICIDSRDFHSFLPRITAQPMIEL
jgi:hypothetical protein